MAPCKEGTYFDGRTDRLCSRTASGVWEKDGSQKDGTETSAWAMIDWLLTDFLKDCGRNNLVAWEQQQVQSRIWFWCTIGDVKSQVLRERLGLLKPIWVSRTQTCAIPLVILLSLRRVCWSVWVEIFLVSYSSLGISSKGFCLTWLFPPIEGKKRDKLFCFVFCFSVSIQNCAAFGKKQDRSQMTTEREI